MNLLAKCGAALIAAAALLVDYVLTVSVSISAGVAAITSAAQGTRLAWIDNHKVALCLVLIGFIAPRTTSGWPLVARATVASVRKTWKVSPVDTGITDTIRVCPAFACTVYSALPPGGSSPARVARTSW